MYAFFSHAFVSHFAHRAAGVCPLEIKSTQVSAKIFGKRMRELEEQDAKKDSGSES